MKTAKMLFAAMVLAVPGNVRAHDWYPKECCGGNDCAPATVEQIQVTPALAQHLQTTLPTAMMITTKHGVVIVPSGFKARVSKDGRAHACIVKVGFGQSRLICLWLPPNI